MEKELGSKEERGMVCDSALEIRRTGLICARKPGVLRWDKPGRTGDDPGERFPDHCVGRLHGIQ
jgi:hypothetical protein